MYFLFTYYPLYNFKRLYQSKEDALLDLENIISISIEFWQQEDRDLIEQKNALRNISKGDVPCQLMKIDESFKDVKKHFINMKNACPPFAKQATIES